MRFPDLFGVLKDFPKKINVIMGPEEWSDYRVGYEGSDKFILPCFVMFCLLLRQMRECHHSPKDN